MDKYVVSLEGYGDFDCTYTEAYMVGGMDPKKVFKYFDHPKMTGDLGKDYVPAYRHEREVLEALIRHFEKHGYTKLKVQSFAVGD